LRTAQDLLPKTPDEVRAHNEGRMPGIIGPSRMTDIYKPIVAAINGVAYAGGLEWACFADIRIAEEHATFGVLCRRWNIGLGDGGTQRFPRIVGTGRAIELIITGRVFDAAEASRIGFVSEIVPRGQGLLRAIELAESIARLPQEAIHTDKEAVYRGFGLELKEGLRVEAECFNRLIGSAETAEGIRRFLERDHPDRRRGAPGVTPGLK
jgi:enoyl-CoA hydratase